MSKRTRKRTGGRTKGTGILTQLRRDAIRTITQLQRVGQKRLAALDQQLERLTKLRRALVAELDAALSGLGARGRRRGKGAGRQAAKTAQGPRRRRRRVDWNKVYAQLPKDQFQAADVKRLVPGVAAGTVSQRLTGWVKAKKLRRTGSRRGTRYRKAA